MMHKKKVCLKDIHLSLKKKKKKKERYSSASWKKIGTTLVSKKI